MVGWFSHFIMCHPSGPVKWSNQREVFVIGYTKQPQTVADSQSETTNIHERAFYQNSVMHARLPGLVGNEQ